MPSTSTLAAMHDSSDVTDSASFMPAAVQASLHSRTTGTEAARGVGTVMETDTPVASGPSALANWLAPANDRLVTMAPPRPAALSFFTSCDAGAYSVVMTSTLGLEAMTCLTSLSVMSTLRLIDTDTGVRLNFLSTAATVSKF